MQSSEPHTQSTLYTTLIQCEVRGHCTGPSPAANVPRCARQSLSRHGPDRSVVWALCIAAKLGSPESQGRVLRVLRVLRGCLPCPLHIAQWGNHPHRTSLSPAASCQCPAAPPDTRCLLPRLVYVPTGYYVVHNKKAFQPPLTQRDHLLLVYTKDTPGSPPGSHFLSPILPGSGISQYRVP
jgi:hypothetical protein